MSHTSKPDKLPGMWYLYSNIMHEYNDVSNSLPVNSSQKEITAYLKDDLSPPLSSALDYRKTNLKFSKLKKLAIKYLCIPPATVFSERLFSTAGLICDRKRSRLDPERVRMLVFLNKNL